MDMLKLNKVTLVIATSVRINESINALKKSMEEIDFFEVKFISHEKPNNLPEGIQFVECGKMTNTDMYSEYIFSELYKHIHTDYVLVIQSDGYVVRPNQWTDEFYNYDYIGAPWPNIPDAYLTREGKRVNVGNGGFSLRSKKLQELPIKLGLKLESMSGFRGEDGNYCCQHRKILEENGMKWAPVEIAAKFSTEIWIDGISQTESFGFHGMNRPNNRKYFL